MKLRSPSQSRQPLPGNPVGECEHHAPAAAALGLGDCSVMLRTPPCHINI